LKGLGDAVYSARHHVGDEPFVVLLGDTILDSAEPVTRQLLEKFDENGESVIALEEVPHEKVSRYGVIDGEEVSDGLYKVKDFVEKPSPDKAPSNLAIAGRYALTPKVFELLSEAERGINNEIQLTDALIKLLAFESVYGLRFAGHRFDIGSKLDFVKTNVMFALGREDLAEDMLEFIRDLAKEGE
jgi:UTP--glucose-1-phosphate uridylyltransferase